MYQQYQQQHHQSHGGQANGGHPNRESSDPIEVRQQYRNDLATLTFNSKPIITSLTISAGENVSVSKVIVQTIEERFRTAPPNQKLPTLYLIDSILKNVGGPYLNLFGRTIVSLFLDAYQVVDSAAKASFEKVLGTWPNWHSQIFPRDTITSIERGVQSIRQQRQQQQQQQQPQPSFQPSSMHINPHFSERPHDISFNQGQGQMYGSNGSPASQNRILPAPTEPRPDNVLLKDIQLLMLQKQQAIILNPSDQASAKQVAILQQLETIVKTTQLTPDNANMIRQQLAQLWTPTPGMPGMPGYLLSGMSQGMPMVSSPMPPNMIMMPPPLPHHLQQQQQQQPIHPPNAHLQQPGSSQMPLPPFPGMPPPHFAPHMPPPGSVASPQAMMGSLPTPIPALSGNIPMPMPPMPMGATLGSPAAPPTSVPGPLATSQQTAGAVPPAASGLFASLLQSGLLGPNGSLTNQLLQNTANMNRASQSPQLASALPTPPMPMSPMPPAASLDRAAQSEQDQSIMSLGLIGLTSQDIHRRRPNAIQAMYGTPPLQCNQCGYRCPKSADAQKKMDAHLDWHFRQNRRMKDKAKKSHSRSWLVGEEDWIHSREGDVGQNQQPVFFDFGAGVSKTSKDELALQEEVNALKEQIVSEISLTQSLQGDEAETITSNMATNTIAKGCSICKEKFIKIWNEEEWSYKNAIVIDKVIYHATCQADLLRSNLRQVALAEAALTAAATALASAPAQPSEQQMESSTGEAKSDPDQKPSGEDDDKGAILAQLNPDEEMRAADSDSPFSLKRKIEIDQHDQELLSSKRTILEQDV